MPSDEPEPNIDQRHGLPKTRPLVRRTVEADVQILAPAVIPYDSPLQPFATLVAHTLGCSMAWIDLGVNGYASHPSAVQPGSLEALVNLNDIRRSLFPLGPPRELTLLPESTVHSAHEKSKAGLQLFVAACPIRSPDGSRSGLIVAASGKIKRLTPDQIEAFRGLAKIVAESGTTSKSPQRQPRLISSSALTNETLRECNDAAWVVDPKSGRFLAVNWRALELLGYDEAEFLKFRGAAEISVNAKLSPFTEDKRSGARTLCLKCASGEIVSAEITSVPLDMAGKAVRLEIIRDVSHIRQADERLKFQAAALSQVSDAVIGLDKNLRITHWNAAAERMYGWRASDVFGEKLNDILTPVWPDKNAERTATTAMLTIGKWNGTVTHHNRNGDPIQIESVATAIRDDSSFEAAGFYCVNRDVTHNTQIESSLALTQTRYKSLFDANPDAVLSLDLSGRIVSLNNVAQSLFGLSNLPNLTSNLAAIIAPGDLTSVLKSFDCAKQGETVKLEFGGQTLTGKPVNIAAVMLPVTVNRTIDGVYLVAQDIGARKRLERVASAENAVLKRLSGRRPLDEVIDRLIASLEDILDGVRCSITILKEIPSISPSLNEIVANASEYVRGQFPRDILLGPDRAATRAIITKHRTLIKLSEQAESETNGRRSSKAVCSTPIVDGSGNVAGAFNLLLSESRDATLDELKIADRATAIIAIAIESSKTSRRLSLTERAIDATVASVIITDPTRDGRPIVYANQAFENITGYALGEVIGRDTSFLRGPETEVDQLSAIESAIATESEHQALIQYYAKSGRTFWSSSSLSPVRDHAGRLTHYVEVINDVTPLMNAMASIRGSEERFRQLVEHAGDLIMLVEESGTVRYASPAIERIMGHSADEVVGAALIEFVHPEDLPHASAVFSRLIETPDTIRTLELRVQRHDGTWCYLEATIQNHLKTSGLEAIVVNARDLSERIMATDQIDRLAFHDTLTDLPNRQLFNDRLGRCIIDARRNETMVAVMFLDVNRFKVINDSLGHSVGDRLLKHVALRLVATARDGDTVARWGGDEFTLIISNVASTRDAARVAQRVINSLSAPFDIDGKELFTTVSIGISMFPAAGEDIETLVRNADTAMYRAKDEGQSSYQFYTTKMNEGAGERLELESNLRRALERHEFELFYQPQIDTSNGRIVSAEALVRWRHPERGLVPPKDFIPLAEETGLIVPMGDWIMREACDQTRAWHDAGFGTLRVAVNLSARQFSQRDLHQTVLRILRESKADPCGLELELTESLLINGEDRVIAAMNDLTALGVTVSIDDFGIGYASYAYLKRYPVKALKIDQSFVRGMLTDSHDNAIIQSIISMAHSLKLNVIAEGVETAEQRDALVALECDLIQGYFYGRPMPAADFTKMLEQQNISELSSSDIA